MTADILIRFLRAGLINVGGDDAKLERLKETASDLAASLKKSPSKAAAFALIAFDPKAPTEDPVVVEALEALQSRWATYVNTFSGTPVTVIRAVLLQALVQAAAEEDSVGVSFVASARNALPFMEAGHERGIWSDVITDVEYRVDARAQAEWATPESITVPTLTLSTLEPITITSTPTTINKAYLASRIEAAVGPNNAAGQATSGNQYWPNQGQHWAQQFAPKLTDLLAEALTAVAKGNAIAPLDLSAPLNGLIQAMSAYVDGTLKAVSGATAGLQRRTNLIWWKESLFSPSAGASYRGLPGATAAALMAFDLHKQVPTFSPASVAAFLHEAVLVLPTLDPKQGHSIRDLIDEAIASPELATLRDAAKRLVLESEGRGPILGVLGHDSRQSLPQDTKFRDKVGVLATDQLTIPEWATWLFRELQAARAAKELAETKKRGRKP